MADTPEYLKRGSYCWSADICMALNPVLYESEYGYLNIIANSATL
jgi:hypothetical protein